MRVYSISGFEKWQKEANVCVTPPANLARVRLPLTMVPWFVPCHINRYDTAGTQEDTLCVSELKF